jgi:replicative DNA helicase
MQGHKSLGWKTIEEAAKEEFKYMQGRASGEILSMRTRFQRLNSITMDGFEWGSINTIAGMSGSGKTTWLNQLEEDFVNPALNSQNIAVLNFNFEMKSRRLIGKKVSSHFKKSSRDLYSADGTKLDSDSLNKIKDFLETKVITSPVFYSEISGDYEEVGDTIIDFSAKFPDKKIIVNLDHTVLVKNKDFDSQTDKMYKLLAEFNDLKKHLEVMYFLLSQLNRDIESTDRRIRPQLHFPIKSDLFGSDATYQYSDLVFVIHRPEMLNLDAYGPDGWGVRDIVYGHAIKTRDGVPVIVRFQNDLANNSLIEI